MHGTVRDEGVKGGRRASLCLVLAAWPGAAAAVPPRSAPGCDSAALAYVALAAQQHSDRRELRRCLARPNADCRAERRQLETTRERLRLLEVYLRGCTR